MAGIRVSEKLKGRWHKGKYFKPTITGGKREINAALVGRYTDEYGHPARIADKHYFRVYKHKGQKYTLYIGPEKESHGGLRHRSETGVYKTKKYRIQTPRAYNVKTREEPVQESDVQSILKNYDKIESGAHSGKYKHKDTGMIVSERQLRIALATRREQK